MTTPRVHTLPLSWDDARDTPFFRITARLFTPDFCLGASVLLAGNDVVDDLPSVPPSVRTVAPAVATAARHDGLGVRVRRSA